MLDHKQDIKNWLDENGIINYTINEDLSVDVDTTNISYKALTEIPVKFNIINGKFNCEGNELTSTEFFPKEVYGYFSCYNNQFKNLDNFPKIVTGWIDIRNNPNLENIIGLWNCDFRGTAIYCDKKWKEEVECYLISINRLEEVEILC
jgi:hypothetical protein